MTEPTDAELIAELEAAGVSFLAFLGGLSGAKKVWTTSGSQDAKKIAAGMRAAIAKWGTPPAVAGEPVGWMWQHDETGRTGFVDCWQVENGWQENNPRLRLISKLYTTPQPTQAQAGAELAEADRRAGAAERELASCREDVARFTRLRDQMKEQWGVDRNVSFDVVWAEALKLKKQAGAVPLTDEQLKEVMDLVSDWGMQSHLRGEAELDAHNPEATEDEITYAKECAEKERAAWNAIKDKLKPNGIKGGQHGESV